MCASVTQRGNKHEHTTPFSTHQVSITANCCTAHMILLEEPEWLHETEQWIPPTTAEFQRWSVRRRGWLASNQQPQTAGSPRLWCCQHKHRTEVKIPNTTSVRHWCANSEMWFKSKCSNKETWPESVKHKRSGRKCKLLHVSRVRETRQKHRGPWS